MELALIHEPKAYTKEELSRVYNHVCPSVVSVVTERSPSSAVPGCIGTRLSSTGFIVYSDKSENCRSVVAVHSYTLKDNEGVSVEFYDGVHCKDVVMLLEIEDFTLLLVRESTRHDSLKSVDFCKQGVTKYKEQIFSVIPINQIFCMFTSNVIQPSCAAYNPATSAPIEGSDDVFAFKCPVAITLSSDPAVDIDKRDVNLKRIIGAPLFSMDGTVVGIIKSCGLSYALKFGKKDRCFSIVLNNWLATNDGWKNAISSAMRTSDVDSKSDRDKHYEASSTSKTACRKRRRK